MEIKNFLVQWAGKWFAQRTSYQLNQPNVDSEKSELAIEFFAIENPDVIKLCEKYQVEPSSTLGGIKVIWNNSLRSAANLLVFVPDMLKTQTGEFLHASWRGQYALGKDDALTLNVVQKEFSSTERIWFASPNLKLRTVLTEYPDNRTHTVFYTEIRKVTSPAKD